MTEKRYWFPAKRYGWGWGVPSTWEGWLVFIAFFAFVALGVVLFPPTKAATKFIAYEVVLSAMLCVICWWKGEPPRWRWGGDE
jgi:lipoprotein signal peptidase